MKNFPNKGKTSFLCFDPEQLRAYHCCPVQSVNRCMGGLLANLKSIETRFFVEVAMPGDFLTEKVVFNVPFVETKLYCESSTTILVQIGWATKISYPARIRSVSWRFGKEEKVSSSLFPHLLRRMFRLPKYRRVGR